MPFRSGWFDFPAPFEQAPTLPWSRTVAPNTPKLSKAERYREAANRYGELAKEAQPDYLAEVSRKIAVQYFSMAEDLLQWAQRPEAKS